ncbi:NAD(P)/FAD-dependent oxidoreductase [Ammoniphilus sp. YIM 78166]|uniref:NAD(P)/FAD-dependent oxidoreductase n=1 Tax=Ammoniphilus sp. YIM 78166 TaxID=1644106 RepID=UPI00106F9972|nr:FAD-dependent oxidoreductase [Ammoniphilus sp. YIM 78166]
MTANQDPIVIIGGGISGVMAARTLAEAGEDQVLLLDKGRGLGGRMVTRAFQGAKIDHGVQYFTAHSQAFQHLVKQWQEQGWVNEWKSSLTTYYGTGGMNALVKHLADPVDFCVRVRVTQVQAQPNGWLLRWISEEQDYVAQTYSEVPNEAIYDPGKQAVVHARAIISTVPAPQLLYLLDQGKVQVEQFIREKLQAIQYLPCLTALVVLKEPCPLQEFLNKQLPYPLKLITDNFKKGISEVPALTIQIHEEWSKENFWREDQDILGEILKVAEPWVGTGEKLGVALKRWTYSLPSAIVRESFMSIETTAPLLIAGDVFVPESDPLGYGRVETAVLSGIAAAKALLELEKKKR